MATFYDPNKDKEGQDGTAAPAAPLQTSAPSGTIQGGSGSAAPGGAPTATGQQGTGYVNLQKYLNANQGRGAGMATNLSGNISNDAEQGKTDLTKDSDNFKKDVDAHTYTYNYNKLEDGSDASKVLGMKGGYNGQTAYNNGDVQAEIDKANGRIQGTSDPNNVREQWTAQNNTAGNYGGGKSAFDSSLMQGDTSAKGVFDALRGKYNNYGNTYTDAQSANNTYAGTAAQTTNSELNKARAATPQAISQLKHNLAAGNAGAVKQRNAEIDASYDQALKDAAAKYGVDPASVVSKTAATIGNPLAGVSAEDLGKLNALSNFAGLGDARYTNTGAAVNQGGVSNVNMPRVKELLGTGISGLETQLKSIQDKIRLSKNMDSFNHSGGGPGPGGGISQGKVSSELMTEYNTLQSQIDAKKAFLKTLG